MKMMQTVVTMEMYRYVLQPGDATKYQFALVPLDCQACSDGRRVLYDPKTDALDLPRPELLSPNDVVTGISGDAYVTLMILMPSWQGSCEILRENLRALERHTWGYVMGKMPGADKYTVAAVLLAASKLINDPFDLEGACQAMHQDAVAELLEGEW